MGKKFFVDFPLVILIASLVWHFLIAKNNFAGFETTATFLLFNKFYLLLLFQK
ncbi:hypothetical protein [Dolosigranulum pigrum]